jgi:hypothetical protein
MVFNDTFKNISVISWLSVLSHTCTYKSIIDRDLDWSPFRALQIQKKYIWSQKNKEKCNEIN